ncbi:MAG: hypothetical protein ACI9WU_003924 [Myxococcota bacterium]|jgi:hypothetical protein
MPRVTYDLKKLQRSLGKRVLSFLKEQLPEAEISEDGEDIRIKAGELDGTVSLGAMVEACHKEDREMWGTIAGAFCNLVVSRVKAFDVEPVSDAGALSRVFPVVQPENEADDRLISDATPDDGLLVAHISWLPGLRVEFNYEGEDVGRRLFQRDLRKLGIDVETLLERSVSNMKAVVPTLEIKPVSSASMVGRVLAVSGEGLAPAMLRAQAGHEAMFAAVERATGEQPQRVLACAPRSDHVTFCNIKDRTAASAMVSRAWALYADQLDNGVPLSPRLFVVGAQGDVRFLDVGIGADRVSDWTEHDLGGATIRCPDDWWVKEQEDRWVIWPGAGGPRIRARVVASGGTPASASQLAERVRDKHKSAGDVGYGFFNGLPWAWVDTGHHDGFSTASMFVVIATGMVIFQTEVPDATEQAQAVTLQKVIATVQSG